MKVFGIGLPKTGTSSLTAALDILGFRPALHNPMNVDEIAQCGSATDVVIACRFDKLAKLWPDSKFIYTNRPVDEWLRSSERHFIPGWQRFPWHDYNDPRYSSAWFWIEATLDLFGACEFDHERWREAKLRHEQSIRDFFAGQRDRLLTCDLTRQRTHRHKWTPLCRFLDVPVPGVPFPHLNKTLSLSLQ